MSSQTLATEAREVADRYFRVKELRCAYAEVAEVSTEDGREYALVFDVKLESVEDVVSGQQLSPESNDHLPKIGAMVSGKISVNLMDKDSGGHSLGDIPLESPLTRDNVLRVRVPLSAQVAKAIVGSWRKGRWSLSTCSPCVVITYQTSGQKKAILHCEIPKGTPVTYREPTDNKTTSFPLEEGVLERIQDKILPAVISVGVLGLKLKVIRSYLQKGGAGGWEEATLGLRILLMNDLTEVPLNEESGKREGPRVLRANFRAQALKSYEGEALEVRKAILDGTESFLRVNLDVLHKHVKDTKLVSVPDPEIIEYIFRNLSSVAAYIEG